MGTILFVDKMVQAFKEEPFTVTPGSYQAQGI